MSKFCCCRFFSRLRFYSPPLLHKLILRLDIHAIQLFNCSTVICIRTIACMFSACNCNQKRHEKKISHREKTLRHSFISTDRNDLIFCSCQRLHYNFWFKWHKGLRECDFILFSIHLLLWQIFASNGCVFVCARFLPATTESFHIFSHSRTIMHKRQIKCVELQINQAQAQAQRQPKCHGLLFNLPQLLFY